jgi:hypothetical protein
MLFAMDEPKIKLGISVLKHTGEDGMPCVGLSISPHAFVEVLGEPLPGLGMSPRNARIVAQRLLEVATLIEDGYL